MCGARNLPSRRLTVPPPGLRYACLASTMESRGPKFGLRLTGMPGPSSPMMKFATCRSRQRAGPADCSTASRICHCRRTPGRGGSRGRRHDKAVGVGGDVVDDVELAGIGAGSLEFYQLAVRRVFVDAGIAVAVGDVDFSLRQRGVGAAVERLAVMYGEGWFRMPMVSNTCRWSSICAQCGRRHRCNKLSSASMCSPCAVEQGLAPGDEIALAVEHDHG